jgi:hypothetical protein
MVNVRTTIATPTQRAKEKMERLRKLHTLPGVRVEPADDNMRRLLKHPRAGGFRSEGSIEWPNDTFTQRRLREGSIKLADAKGKAPAPQHHRGDAS